MDTFFCFKFSDECCHRTFNCCRPPAMAAVSLLKWAWVFVETRTVAHLCGRRTASLQSPTPRCSEAFVMKLQAAKWNLNCKENLFQLVSLPQSTKAPSLQELMFEFQLTFDTQKLATKSSVFLHLHLRWLINWCSDVAKVRQENPSAKSDEWRSFKLQIIHTHNNKCKISMHRFTVYINFAIYTYTYTDTSKSKCKKTHKLLNINTKNVSKILQFLDFWFKFSKFTTLQTLLDHLQYLDLRSTKQWNQRRRLQRYAGMPKRLEGWNVEKLHGSKWIKMAAMENEWKWRNGERDDLSCRTLRALFWGVSVLAGFGCCRHLLSGSNHLRNSHS